jgi:hypothetical protein
MIALVISIWSAAGPMRTLPPSDPTGPVRCCGEAPRMLASRSVGVALVIWAAAVDPADVPMIRSASVTSIPASHRPAMTPINHALPADPAPPRTNALSPSEAVVEVKCRDEEGVVFMGVAFRELPVGHSRWRLPQSRSRELQGSTHCGYSVHGNHLLPTDFDRRQINTLATASLGEAFCNTRGERRCG